MGGLFNKKYYLLPCMRVNYRLVDILRAFTISSNNDTYISALEHSLSILYNVDDVLLTGSGRSALYYILKYLPQKKVIVPAYTCDAVVEAAILACKTVIYAHIDVNTLDISTIPELDGDTVLIATHQFGVPCNIKHLCEVCRQHNAVVIEDCAGAFALKINGQMAGTYADFAVFSFNSSKLINAPSTGGFIIAKNKNDINQLKENIVFKRCTLRYKLKNLYKSAALCLDKNANMHYWISKAIRRNPSNSHLIASIYTPQKVKLGNYAFGFYNWQAYIVLKQLAILPSLLERRKYLMTLYNNNLKQQFRKEHFNRSEVCIRYPIYLKDRDNKRNELRDNGLDIGFGFEHFVCPDNYLSEIQMSKLISYLPFSSNYSDKECEFIIRTLNLIEK